MFQPSTSSKHQAIQILPLLALFFGGILFVFIGFNAWDIPDYGLWCTLSWTGPIHHQREFRFLSYLDTQIWLAIIGIGVGILVYGFTETFVCLIDSKGSQKLENPIILQSPARGPFSMRQWLGLTFLRYLLPLVSFTVPLEYQFGLVNVNAWVAEKLNEEDLFLSTVPVQWIDFESAITPWITDGTSNDGNQAFTHRFAYPIRYDKPPQTISMVGMMECGLFEDDDYGDVVTREMIMVANMTKESGNFSMTRDHTGWIRAQTTNRGWLYDPNKSWCDDAQWAEAVVDYRIAAPGKIQIQWTRLGPWLSDGSTENSRPESVVAECRVTYDMYYAVAEVRRAVESGKCGDISHVNVLAYNTESLTSSGIKDGPHNIWNWVNALIGDEKSCVADGVSAIVRAIMTLTEREAQDRIECHKLGFLTSAEQPFGSELTPPKSCFSDSDTDIERFIEIVASGKSKANGGEVTVLLDQELELMELNVASVKEMVEEMGEIAGDGSWRLELVDLPGGLTELRGYIDDALEKDSKAKCGDGKKNDSFSDHWDLPDHLTYPRFDGVSTTRLRGLTSRAAYMFVGIGSVAIIVGLKGIWLCRRVGLISGDYTHL